MMPPTFSASIRRNSAAPAGSDAIADRLSAMTHDLLAAADTRRRLQWTNPAWQPLLGWTAAELAAASYHRLVHPDDLDRVRRAEHAVLAGRAGERPETELRLRTRSGDYRWFVFGTSFSPKDELVFFSGKDITARKQGEEQLRVAEERFRAVTGADRDAIVSADADGRIVFWNAGAEATFGRSAAEALGQPLTDLLPERHRKDHLAVVARLLASGDGAPGTPTVELEGLRADGSEFPLELSLGSWSESGGRYFTGVFRDVSERLHARRALQEAEQRFSGAFEGAAVGLLLAAPDGTLLRANRALCELSGRPEQELVGRSFDELLHPDERGADAEAMRAMLAGGTEPLAAERRFECGDGSTGIVRINLSLIRGAGGEPLHFVGQVEDVTERRRTVAALRLSEARYKGLIEHLPDSTVHLFDGELRLLFCEGERLRSHGYEPRELEGKLLREVLPAGAFVRLEPAYRAALAGETRSFDLDSTDGSATYWVQTVPLRDDRGRIAGGMALSRDISDRRRAERLLEERARELERSNAELEQFAFIASHDLSEPLRMIAGHLQLLRRRYRGELDEDADAMIEFAVGGAARMRHLIDDLLTYSHAGRADQPSEPVDLHALAECAAELLRAPAAAGASISVGPLPTLPGNALGLGQLLQNLIENAVKFVPAGQTAEVEVGAQREGAMWCFTVADNGIGLDPAHAEQIFRMFGRLHSDDDYPGTGIGLAIAKKVVERHGGRIWAEPRAERGSRFCFTLPAG